MKYVIDRIAGDVAVLEGYESGRLEVKKALLPTGAKEGSSIEVDERGGMTLFRDEERERRIAEKMKAVWR